MSLAIVWHRPALATLRQLPFHSAMMVDRAILHFAESGAGHVEWDPPYYRLRAGFHDAILSIDMEIRRLTVLRIYRMR